MLCNSLNRKKEKEKEEENESGNETINFGKIGPCTSNCNSILHILSGCYGYILYLVHHFECSCDHMTSGVSTDHTQHEKRATLEGRVVKEGRPTETRRRESKSR